MLASLDWHIGKSEEASHKAYTPSRVSHSTAHAPLHGMRVPFKFNE